MRANTGNEEWWTGFDPETMVGQGVNPDVADVYALMAEHRAENPDQIGDRTYNPGVLWGGERLTKGDSVYADIARGYLADYYIVDFLADKVIRFTEGKGVNSKTVLEDAKRASDLIAFNNRIQGNAGTPVIFSDVDDGKLDIIGGRATGDPINPAVVRGAISVNPTAWGPKTVTVYLNGGGTSDGSELSANHFQVPVYERYDGRLNNGDNIPATKQFVDPISMKPYRDSKYVSHPDQLNEGINFSSAKAAVATRQLWLAGEDTIFRFGERLASTPIAEDWMASTGTYYGVHNVGRHALLLLADVTERIGIDLEENEVIKARFDRWREVIKEAVDEVAEIPDLETMATSPTRRYEYKTKVVLVADLADSLGVEHELAVQV